MDIIKCKDQAELEKEIEDFMGVTIGGSGNNWFFQWKNYVAKIKIEDDVCVVEKTETRRFTVEPPKPKRTPKKDELWLCGLSSRPLYSTGEQNENGAWIFYPCATNSLTSSHYFSHKETYPSENIKPACQKCGSLEGTCECSNEQ